MRSLTPRGARPDQRRLVRDPDAPEVTDGAATRVDSGVAYRAVLLALGLLAAGLLIEQLVQLVMLVTIAIVIALPIAAAASWLERWRVPRPIGAVLALAIGCLVVGVVLTFVVPTFVAQVEGFVGQLPVTVSHVERSVNNLLGLRRGTTTKAVTRFADRYTQHPAMLLGPLSAIGVSIATAVGAIVVVVISALYMAINPQPLVNGLLRLFPAWRRTDVKDTLERIRGAWLGWMRGVALDMIVLGGLLYIGMRIIGLPFAVGFAMFSALMTVIPNYGSVISAIPPIAFGLTRSFHEAVLVTVVYVIVNQVEGNVALPLIMGRSVRLHPAIIALGVLVVGSLFGIVGLFVSVPLISLALILGDELWVRPHGSSADAAVAEPQRRGRPRTRGARAVYGAILMGAVLIVAALVAQQLISLVLATMLTIIISLPLSVCAERLGALGIPRPVGALIGLLAGVAVIAGGLALLLPPVLAQAKILVAAAPGMLGTAEMKLSSVTGDRPGHLAAELQRDLAGFLRDPSNLLGPISTIGISAATLIGGAVIAVITAYYIAAQPTPLSQGLLGLFSPDERPRAQEILARVRGAWLGWLRGLAASMAIIGVLLYIALGLVLGLPFALVFAVISACAEVVPYLGALASGIPPVAFALTISPTRAIEVLIIYVLIHQIEANVIGPLIMSRAVRLHPAVIAIGVVAVGEMFGLLGLIVAVPILSLVAILVDVLWIERRDAAAEP
jgi:predicted PurR-regulated permease PerM